MTAPDDFLTGVGNSSMSRTGGILDLTPGQRSALTAWILADLRESLAAADMPEAVVQMQALALVDPRLAGVLLEWIELAAQQARGRGDDST